jgi:hypothetical protein
MQAHYSVTPGRGDGQQFWDRVAEKVAQEAGGGQPGADGKSAVDCSAQYYFLNPTPTRGRPKSSATVERGGPSGRATGKAAKGAHTAQKGAGAGAAAAAAVGDFLVEAEPWRVAEPSDDDGMGMGDDTLKPFSKAGRAQVASYAQKVKTKRPKSAKGIQAARARRAAREGSAAAEEVEESESEGEELSDGSDDGELPDEDEDHYFDGDDE